MAYGSLSLWGPVVTLNHQETNDVIAVAGDVAKVVHTISEAMSESDLAVVGFALDAVAIGISAHAALIEAVDQGSGVFLTSPWVALGAIVPTAVPPGVGLSDDWATRDTGEFKTFDTSDLVRYTIERGVVGADVIGFELRAKDARMWRKVLVLRDGLGGQWDIKIDPSQGTFTAGNALWTDQVKNGQTLSLWKAKEFGVNHWILDFRGLENLRPGDRVTLDWVRDGVE